MPATKPPLINTWGNTNTSSPDMATPSYVDTGFPAPSGGIAVKPPRGYINWLFNFLTNAVRYFMQRGISDWDAGENGYGAGSVVRYGPGTTALDGTRYQLVGTATTGTAPPADPANWIPLGRDGYGLPFGGYSEWFETWAGFGIYTNSAGTGSVPNGIGRWQYRFTGTDTNAKVQAVSLGAPSLWGATGGPFFHVGGVQIQAGKNAGDLARVLEVFPMATLDDNIILSLETVMGPPITDTAYWLFGFSSNQDVNVIADGAFFIVSPGNTTWHARTIVNNVATDQDTGIAVGSVVTPRRLRIVCRGANMKFAGSSGSRQIQFYIDDQWVAASNANLPFVNVGGTGVDGSSGAVATILGGQRSSTASVASSCFYGPVRYAQRSATSA